MNFSVTRLYPFIFVCFFCFLTTVSHGSLFKGALEVEDDSPRPYRMLLEWEHTLEALDKNTTTLCLRGQSLGAVPMALKRFKKLEVLDLSHNNIKLLPDFMGDFPCLKELFLDQNNLKQLPFALFERTSLRITCTGNNLTPRSHEKLMEQGKERSL